jgi:arsenate reductase
MKKVLFVCTHNAGRSQMAEALLRDMCPRDFESHSAGMHPTTINPLATKVLAELGIDITHQRSKSVFDYIRTNESFDYIITLCDEAAQQHCPTFPGRAEKMHWSFPDPAALTGTEEQRLGRTRQIRDAIKQKLANWCAEMCVSESA